MKEFLMKSLAKKIEDADLNREAASAAGFYVKQQGKHLSMVEQQNMANHVAHGFHMGWVECEKSLGLRK